MPAGWTVHYHQDRPYVSEPCYRVEQHRVLRWAESIEIATKDKSTLHRVEIRYRETRQEIDPEIGDDSENIA